MISGEGRKWLWLAGMLDIEESIAIEEQCGGGGRVLVAISCYRVSTNATYSYVNGE